MQELESGSLYDLVRERGVTLASARQVIGARSATAKEAKLLSEHRGAALLTLFARQWAQLRLTS